LRLPGSDASRRHAEISGGARGFTLRDLGSTNGTYVNGERIREHLLQRGDQIEIGASLITFCQVGGGLENIELERATEQTTAQERPATGQVFEGDLSEIPPGAVLQILQMGGKSGLLGIEFAEGVGRLWLSDGAPVHAETTRHSGFDAAMEIATATVGRFTFQPHERPAEITIKASVMELLLEASRILDEEHL
jgi:pSer/pThr/pTyr-binding forkhead associated (FHA) protein